MGKKGIFIAIALVLVVLVFAGIVVLNDQNQRLGQDAYNKARYGTSSPAASAQR